VVGIPFIFAGPRYQRYRVFCGAKVGSITYNLAHTSAFPVILALVAWLTGWSVGLPIAMIWLAHIGMDRMVGYGLKYPDSFKQNHLGRV
jgi:hypothetical protein